MKGYYRVMLGRKSVHAPQCFEGGFTGTHFDIHEDLSGKLPDTWRPFNTAYVPVYLNIHPDKSKVAAGLACGAIWTVSKGLRPGDVILSPPIERCTTAASIITDSRIESAIYLIVQTYPRTGLLAHSVRYRQWLK